MLEIVLDVHLHLSPLLIEKDKGIIDGTFQWPHLDNNISFFSEY